MDGHLSAFRTRRQRAHRLVWKNVCAFSNSSTPRIDSTFSVSASGPTLHDTPSPKQDSDSNCGPKSLSIAIAMQAPLHFVELIARCNPAFFRNRRERVIVEVALRQQLATYNQRKVKARPTSLDRAFWDTLFRLWPRWRQALVIVRPDTVVRWHRIGFKLYRRWISKPGPGRPPISAEAWALIKRLALDNAWGARKIKVSSHATLSVDAC